ncbi:MAG: hypothetical protein JXR05_13090 [Flavobacteriaceae bacterium]
MFKKYLFIDILFWLTYLWFVSDWSMGWTLKLVLGYVLTIILNSIIISISAQNSPRKWSDVKESRRVLMAILWPMSFLLGLLDVFQSFKKKSLH